MCKPWEQRKRQEAKIFLWKGKNDEALRKSQQLVFAEGRGRNTMISLEKWHIATDQIEFGELSPG